MVLMVVLTVTLLPTWTDGFNGGIKSNYLPEQMVLMVVLKVTTYLNRWF